MSYNSRFLLYYRDFLVLFWNLIALPRWYIIAEFVVLFIMCCFCAKTYQIINTAKHIHDLLTHFLFCSCKCQLYYSFLCIVILLKSFDLLKPILLQILQIKTMYVSPFRRTIKKCEWLGGQARMRTNICHRLELDSSKEIVQCLNLPYT